MASPMHQDPVLARLLNLADDATKHKLLMKAAACGDEEVLQAILKAADPGIVLRIEGGKTACMAAAKHGHARCCQMLLAAHGAEQQVLQSNAASVSAAMWAAAKGHLDALRVLLAHAPQQQLTFAISRGDWEGYTVLQYAALRGHTAIVAEVLALATNAQQLVAHRNGRGATALSLAAANGHDAALQALLPLVNDSAQLSHALAAVKASRLSDSHKRCCQLLLARGASMSELQGEQRQRIEAVVREVMAAHLVPGTLQQAVTDAVVQLAAAVRPAKRARGDGDKGCGN